MDRNERGMIAPVTFTTLLYCFNACFLARMAAAWTAIAQAPFPPLPHLDQRLLPGPRGRQLRLAPVPVRRAPAAWSTRLDQGHWT
ncbi:MAG TPA: hypothetical protein VEI97_02000 [bacterium]|nr:hypothetical protein [bacterium]